MRMLRGGSGTMKMISSCCSALLLALALVGCGVESGAPLSLPASPRLTSMGTGVVCPPPPSECTGDNLGRCCPNAADCSYKRCQVEGQVCKNEECFVACDAGTDCNGALGLGPTAGFSCGKDQLCVPASCTSNRGCNAGEVCDGPEDAGVCVKISASEPDPGCAAAPSPRTRGGLAPVVAALSLAAALLRRRRSE